MFNQSIIVANAMHVTKASLILINHQNIIVANNQSIIVTNITKASLLLIYNQSIIVPYVLQKHLCLKDITKASLLQIQYITKASLL